MKQKHIQPIAGLASNLREFGRGARIYHAGEHGIAWRVTSGCVRLNREDPEGAHFAGLALAGDVIGAETLLFGEYTFSALALSPCVIEAWVEDRSDTAGDALLRSLAATERRVADILALRCGKAGERVRRLLTLIGSSLVQGGRAVRVVLPRLRDIAEITDLTVETVSRTISHLDADGSLDVEGRYRSRVVSSPPSGLLSGGT